MDANLERPQDGAGNGATIPGRGPNQLGMTAGIAGVAAFLLFFSFTRGVGLFVAIGAMVLGFAARSQARSHYLRTGMANVGIISGLLLSTLYPLILYLESIWPA